MFGKYMFNWGGKNRLKLNNVLMIKVIGYFKVVE